MGHLLNYLESANRTGREVTMNYAIEGLKRYNIKVLDMAEYLQQTQENRYSRNH